MTDHHTPPAVVRQHQHVWLVTGAQTLSDLSVPFAVVLCAPSKDDATLAVLAARSDRAAVRYDLEISQLAFPAPKSCFTRKSGEYIQVSGATTVYIPPGYPSIKDSDGLINRRSDHALQPD